jgi:transcriptional regulator with XRE-family HTH domain
VAQPAQNERNWERIGANVRQRRKQVGMSQEDLAFATGLSPKTIGRMERGEGGQQTDTLIDVARALSIWSGELLRGVK